jgi:predicted enzyme related to lactoylglutathione lyase
MERILNMLREVPAFSGFSVNSKNEALSFYKDVLGCDISDTEMGLELKFPNGHSVFMYEKADHKPASYTTLNFPVPDINGSIDELVAKGVVMERYDNMPAEQDERGVLRGKAAGMGPDIAWFKDPAGNVLAVLEK